MVHGIAESNIISVPKHDEVLSKTGPNDVLVGERVGRDRKVSSRTESR